MFEFTADQPTGVTLFGLGLTERDVKKLQAGQAILVKGEQFGVDCDVLIFAGKDEKSMKKALEGFVGPYTLVNAGKKTTH